MEILKDYSLKSFNTFGLNVDAKYFCRVASLADIREIVKFIEIKKLPYLFIGGGSNILFTKDFDGLIIKIVLRGIEIVGEDSDYIFVKAASGENWDEFVGYCVNHNYAGIENLSLIPGSVGASPIQNIGAYGVEMKDFFHEVEFYDLTDGSVKKFKKGDCHFGYRSSIFKKELKGKVIMLSVIFRLNKKPFFKTDYGVIKDELKRLGVKELTAKAIREAVINIRRRKLPDTEIIGNAGSFYKNPVVTAEKHKKIKSAFPLLVSFLQSDGTYKLAAGWLIEQCGWKGKRVRDSGVHDKQALVLVNYGNATGKDILELSEKIKSSVFEKFGVELEREVNVV